MKAFEFFKEEDHRKAFFVSLIFIMLMILFFLLVSLKEPNPPLKAEVIEFELPDIEIEQGSEAAGGNDNSESETSEPTPNNEVQESTQEIVQQSMQGYNLGYMFISFLLFSTQKIHKFCSFEFDIIPNEKIRGI